MSMTKLTDVIRDHQDAVIERILAPELAAGAYHIVRGDGQYWAGYTNGNALDALFSKHVTQSCAFHTAAGAQHFLDINQGSTKTRREFAGCRVLHLEPGDHVVCTACGSLHERDACPRAMAI